MLTNLVTIPRKPNGKRRFFEPDVEQEIYELYYLRDVPADVIARRFAKQSPTGKLSPSGVRLIALRVAEQQGPPIEKAATPATG